jgi:hypothetical protein
MPMELALTLALRRGPGGDWGISQLLIDPGFAIAPATTAAITVALAAALAEIVPLLPAAVPRSKGAPLEVAE